MSLIQVDVADCKSNVWLAGEGRPVLLIHGFPLDHQMWYGQLEGLGQHFRIIAPDLPGFGRSGVSATTADESLNFTMRSMADWIATLLDALQVADPVVYCGLSMGGYIGWEFARRHSGRLDRLIASNTRAAADSEVVRRGRAVAAREVRHQGVQRVAEAMLPKLFGCAARRGRQWNA